MDTVLLLYSHITLLGWYFIYCELSEFSIGYIWVHLGNSWDRCCYTYKLGLQTSTHNTDSGDYRKATQLLFLSYFYWVLIKVEAILQEHETSATTLEQVNRHNTTLLYALNTPPLLPDRAQATANQHCQPGVWWSQRLIRGVNFPSSDRYLG